MTALRLIDGLEKTDGYDSGRRIAEQFLFEAAASDAQRAGVTNPDQQS